MSTQERPARVAAPRKADGCDGVAAAPRVDLCICSYRRPEIVVTLAAISRLARNEPRRLRVVVADNTACAEARSLVRYAAEEFGLDALYLHAPAANISIARNACLDAARAEWIAFLDDDETPARDWLDALLARARAGGWDAVVGPVIASYPDDAPAWMQAGGFHSTAPAQPNGELATAYTGNVLFRRAAARGLRFRLDLGASGGEDEDFFDRFRRAGGRIGFAPNAVCYERVPSKRAGFGWLIRRNFRAGQSYGARLRSNAAISIALAAAKALFCVTAAILRAPDNIERRRYLTRAALHCGVVARKAGFREIRMY
ncbi:MAG TPA: glycosyltransferase family 2 protein [Rhizomicrobium sp.]|nr:glycosyltransferase family 2 protein [Rhizomicrobium sp.]